jgi:hypothetical protein
MKHQRKLRGDASLFTPGVGRRDFLRRLGASSAAASVAVSAMNADARVAASTRPKFDDMNHAMFAALIGAKFEVKLGTTTVPFELIEVTPLAAGETRPKSLTRREPFSLVFRAPRGTSVMQQILQVSHTDVGTHGIFLVPIAPDEFGPRYEAVFN